MASAGFGERLGGLADRAGSRIQTGVHAVRARVKAHEAVIDLAAGRLTVARQSDDQAAWALRRLLGNRPTDKPKATDLLAVLKAAMVAAHPDRGGTPSDFMAARARYVEARRRMRAA